MSWTEWWRKMSQQVASILYVGTNMILKASQDASHAVGWENAQSVQRCELDKCALVCLDVS